MNGMTIKKKLYLSYGALAALAVVTSVISIVVLSQLKSTTHEVTSVNTAKLFDSGAISSLASDQLYSANAAMLRTAENEPAEANVRLERFSKDSELLRSMLEDYKPLIVTEEEKADYRNIVETLNGSDQDVKQLVVLLRQGKIDIAWPLFRDNLVKPLNDVLANAQKMAAYEQQRSNEVGEEASRKVLVANWMLFLMLIPTLLAGGFVLHIIRRLDAQLRQSIGELAEGSQQVASAAAQVSASSQTLAKDTSAQAAMIEETSASSEEINSMARRNAEHSKTAAEQMAELKLLMDSGSREMETATQAMDDINQSSDKISRIIQVIEKIAFQTNILALNAAVEAARAGEAGKGFAVVADEVRNLAQQCAQAAQDTGVLIEQSQQTSKAGHLRVQKVAEETHKMSLVLDSMKELVDEINGGSQEQGRGIEQIGRAITQMEQGTQKSAANAEESAAAAEELTAQSNVLREVAQRLGDLVGGSESVTGQIDAAHRSLRTLARSSYALNALRPAMNTLSSKVARRSGRAAEFASAATSEKQFPLEEAEFAEF